MSQLSGGQRQAVTLLMATLVRPRLLLLDEHTAALDPRSAEHVLRLTKTIVERDALTVLMVTHSMPQAARLGDRVLMMHQGRIARDMSGARKRRLRSEDLLDIFEELRNAELLDESAAEMLERSYV
jgi:putative ABC transport system ATP-binding protein